MDLVIRRARPADKRQVLEAVRTIWGGHDRVPAVFDRWVTHRSGPFFVAESSGRVIGMGKLTVVSPTEAWLEGGRVGPRRRRRGVEAAAIIGGSSDGSLLVRAIGGKGLALRELLVALRAEAARRGLDDVSFYASGAAQRRAARSAAYRPSWTGAAYLYERSLRR